MYPEIDNILTKYGYQRVGLNIVGVALSVKQYGDYGYVVVTIDETTGNTISRGQFVHISEQIREFLRKRNSYHNAFLYLLISEDDRSAGRLFEDYESFWRIIPTKRQLMVYEKGDAAFQELRKPLENLFPGSYHNTSKATGQRKNFSSRRTSRRVDQNTASYMGNNRMRRMVTFGNGRMPYVNFSVIALNVLIFLFTDFLLIQNDSVVDVGALNWSLVLEQGQWYRLITSMFLHDGIQHIGGNMLILLYVGTCVEQQIGSLRYGILYFGSGVLAGVTSMVYNMRLNTYVFSLGASGAIFGVMGALLFLVIFRNRYAGGYSARQIIVMIFFSLYTGFANQSVDNAAHVGGFIAGFFLAAVLLVRPPNVYGYR